MRNNAGQVPLNFKNVNENPCNMCMPMGGILPFKGVEGAMVIIHGSQGCSTYMRRHMAEHFNEPVDVASSSLNEKATVYGGEKNLKTGIGNLIRAYNPKMVGVLSTCLTETIGEDIDRIVLDYTRERNLCHLPIVTVPTPGYGGTQAQGYWLAARRIIAALARKTPGHGKINVLVPNISPADIREIKRLLQLMQVDYTLFPDFSDTMDRPYRKPYRKLAEGGTKPGDIQGMPGAAATVQLGVTVENSLSPGRYLEEQHGVPLFNVPIPMGIEGTDIFIKVLKDITGHSPPDCLEQERGRLLDCMIDSHKYNSRGRSIIFGESELVYAVAGTCMENGIYPVVLATGSKAPGLKSLFQLRLGGCPGECKILFDADFAAIRRECKMAGANIAIGHSDGRYLTEREGIPLVRLGFPIHDRTGGQRLLSVGYTGTTMFLDRLTNTLLEQMHNTYRSSLYEQYFAAGEK